MQPLYLVILFTFASSMLLPFSAFKSTDLKRRNLDDKISEIQVQHETSLIGKNDLKSNLQPKSMDYFRTNLDLLDTALSQCNVDGKLNIGCYFTAKTKVIQLNEDLKTGKLTSNEKLFMGIILGAIIGRRFPLLDKIAMDICEIDPSAPDCIYFRFKSYARAVWSLENGIHVSLYGSLIEPLHDEADVENLLLEFNDFNQEYERLEIVPVTQWKNEPHYDQFHKLMENCTRLHKEIAAILKSKVLEFWISGPEWKKKIGVIAMMGVSNLIGERAV